MVQITMILIRYCLFLSLAICINSLQDDIITQTRDTCYSKKGTYVLLTLIVGIRPGGAVMAFILNIQAKENYMRRLGLCLI